MNRSRILKSSWLLVLIFLGKKARLSQGDEAKQAWMSDLRPNDIGLNQEPEGKKGKCLGRRKRMMVHAERGSKHLWKAHGANVYLLASSLCCSTQPMGIPQLGLRNPTWWDHGCGYLTFSTFNTDMSRLYSFIPREYSSSLCYSDCVPTHHWACSLLPVKSVLEYGVVLSVWSSVQRSWLGSKAETGRVCPSLTWTMGVSKATMPWSSSGRGRADGEGSGATGGGRTVALDLPAACSSASAAVSCLRLSSPGSQGSPLRPDVSAAVVSEDSRDAAVCLPIFFLPLVVPMMPVLLATDSLDTLGREEVEEADAEADALQPVVFFCWEEPAKTEKVLH